MAETSNERLAEIMQAGFNTLADLIGETNGQLRETNQRLDRTNERLDETNQRLDQTNQKLDETNLRLGRLEGRFDNLLELAGRESRRLRKDVDELQARVTRLEAR